MKKKIDLNDEENEDLGLPIVKDNKITFAKLIFQGNRGPYIVAFEDSCTRTYAEMNALDFKNVNINEIKTADVPIWEPGAKDPEEINALPKLNLKKQKEKALKEKEARKQKRAEKMKATLKAKKEVKKPKGKKK